MDFAEQSNRYKTVMDAIRKYVLEKDFSEEIRLPSETQLATRLDISRAHVREVYRALCVFGVCESRQGEGTFVRNRSHRQIYDTLSILFLGLTSDIMEIMEVRKTLEAGIAENAAINRSSADVREMKLCLRKMRSSSDSRELSRYDNELHQLIGQSCGNEILVELSTIVAGLVHKAILEHWNLIVSDPDHTVRDRTQEQHEELVGAIAGRKPAIAKAVAQEHVELVIRSLSRYQNDFRSGKQREMSL